MQNDSIEEEGGINLTAYAGANPSNMIDPSGLIQMPPSPHEDEEFQRAVSIGGHFLAGAAVTVVGSVAIAALIASGTVVGVVVAGGAIVYGAASGMNALLITATGMDIFGNCYSPKQRTNIGANLAGGLLGAGIGLGGYLGRGGPEATIPFYRNSNGQPIRIAPWGNATNHPIGKYPHYHRAVPDPANPGQSLPGQGIGRHRPWE